MLLQLLKSMSLIGLLTLSLYSQEVIKINKVNGTLENQINSTFEMAKGHDNFWIGYSFEKQDNYNISIGSFTLWDHEINIGLRDLINMTPKYLEFKNQNRTSRGSVNGRAVHITNGRLFIDDEVDAETAILFRYDRSSTGISDFAEISICNMSQYIDLYGFTLFWLDKVQASKSADFVINLFDESKNWFAREELVSAIGIHSGQPQVIPILKGIIYGDEKEDMKEDAIFWLGIQNISKGFGILKDIIGDDDFEELREHAVMALSYIESDEAIEELIKIAKINKESDLREHAIYGLGNKAVKKAELALKNFIENDPDIEIKKRAIYALSEREEENIPYLIELAKNNESLTIRKTAIWSLSNSEDKRAVDALIELAKNHY